MAICSQSSERSKDRSSRLYRRCTTTDSCRRAFTVIEVLVTVALIGLLLALLLPAVQYSRESARAMQCKSNLHQIGIGMHACHEATSALPPPHALRELLPHVGYAVLYESLQHPVKNLNRRVVLYECPSDPYVDINQPSLGISSYLVCQGSSIQTPPGTWDGVYGFNHQDYPPKLGDIKDGLSNTALVAESLLNATSPISWRTNAAGTAYANREPRRFVWYTAKKFDYHEIDLFAEHCRIAVNRISAGPPFLAPHTGWNYGNLPLYNHLLPPNSISCDNGPPPAGVHDKMLESIYVLTASSLHDDGANVLFCDGSVHRISSSIDTHVWRALGTKASGDQIGEF